MNKNETTTTGTMEKRTRTRRVSSEMAAMTAIDRAILRRNEAVQRAEDRLTEAKQAAIDAMVKTIDTVLESLNDPATRERVAAWTKQRVDPQ